MIWIIVAGVVYPSVAGYVPIWNLRVLAFLAVAIGMVGQYRLLRERGFIGIDRATLRAVLLFFPAVLVFELVTVETLDYCKQLEAVAHQLVPAIAVLRVMALAAPPLTVYALVVSWTGIARAHRGWLGAGLTALALGVGVAVFGGWHYAPIAYFTPIINGRTLLFLLVILLLALHTRLLPQVGRYFAVLTGLPGTPACSSPCSGWNSAR